MYDHKQRMSRHELNTILDALPLRWRWVTIFLAATGLRTQEALLVQVGDYNAVTQTLTVPRLKVQRSSSRADADARRRLSSRGLEREDVRAWRTIPLNRTAREAWAALTAGKAPTAYLIHGGRNGHAHRNTLNNVWRQTLRQIQLRPEPSRPMPHATRHRFGTSVCREVGARIAQELLGHADVGITLRYYDHPDEDDLRKGSEAADL